MLFVSSVTNEYKLMPHCTHPSHCFMHHREVADIISNTGLHPPPPAPPAAAARPPPPAPPAAPPAPTAYSAAAGDDDAPPRKMSPFEAALAKKVRASRSEALLHPHPARGLRPCFIHIQHAHVFISQFFLSEWTTQDVKLLTLALLFI